MRPAGWRSPLPDALDIDGSTNLVAAPSSITTIDTGALVAKHRRRVAGGVDAGGGIEIGVADAAGAQAHEDLRRSGVGELDLTPKQHIPVRALATHGCRAETALGSTPLRRRNRQPPNAAGGHGNGGVGGDNWQDRC